MTLSGRLLKVVGPATGKARPPTVDSLTDVDSVDSGMTAQFHEWPCK